MNCLSKLEEYKSILDFSHKHYKQDFKNNYKFIKFAVNKMIKQDIKDEIICNFINDAIDVHNKIYVF